MEQKHWYETKEGQEEFLKILNEKFSFTKDGEIIEKKRHENVENVDDNKRPE